MCAGGCRFPESKQLSHPCFCTYSYGLSTPIIRLQLSDVTLKQLLREGHHSPKEFVNAGLRYIKGALSKPQSENN